MLNVLAYLVGLVSLVIVIPAQIPLLGWANWLALPLIVIGIIIGAVPGVGSSIGNLIAYAETKRTAKDSATFGKGNPKGVIAAAGRVALREGPARRATGDDPRSST